jgi:hypothetical protein
VKLATFLTITKESQRKEEKMYKYELCYSNSATVPLKQAYANEKPFYSQKVIIESETEIDTVAEYEKMRAKIDPLVQKHFNATKLDESGLRVRTKGERKYPSVTSILSPAPYTGNLEYGTRGTEIHRLINHYSVNCEWLVPKEPLKTLKYEDVKYQDFFQTHIERIDFSGLEKEIEVFNDEHMYSGEIDVVCKVDGIKTLGDYKTGSWKWEQLVAYWKALGDKSIKQLAVFDLKKQKLETLKIASDECRSCWERFLVLRGKFEQIYGI